MWLDLLSTFVLTPFFIFTEEDPDFVPDDVELGYRPAPSLACGLGSPAGDTAWRKTLMIFSLFLISLRVCVDCNPRDSGISLLTTA